MIASNDRAEAKRRFREKVAAQKALPASERIANTLHATNSHAEAQALLDEFRAEAVAAKDAEIAALREQLADQERTTKYFAAQSARRGERLQGGAR